MNEPTPTDRFLKLQEVQRMFGISRTTLWRWTNEQGLKVVRVGGVCRIRESDLQAFLARHERLGGEQIAQRLDSAPVCS